MEYCPGGTLESKCAENIEMPLVRRYTCCLLKAVEYIHERLIIHRDIKRDFVNLTYGLIK